jgi:membrane protease YdiL (CAAX protease family)
MHALAALLATALVVLLVAVQPFTGRRRYRRLIERADVDPGARQAHYRRGIVGEWTGVATVVVVGLLAGRTAASIGLRMPDDLRRGWAPVVQIAALLVVSTIFMRRPSFREPLRRQASTFAALLPTSRAERQTFAGLAVSAGICEEILYRGFLMAYVSWLFPGLGSGWVVAITAAGFGVAHAYQGPRGIALTGLVGAAFGSLVVASGSLLPAIVAHALVDLRILFLPDLRLPLPDPSPAPATLPVITPLST